MRLAVFECSDGERMAVVPTSGVMVISECGHCEVSFDGDERSALNVKGTFAEVCDEINAALVDTDARPVGAGDRKAWEALTGPAP